METGQFKAHHANRVYGSRLRRLPARDMTLADMAEKDHVGGIQSGLVQ